MSIFDSILRRGVSSNNLEEQYQKAVNAPIFTNTSLPAYPSVKSSSYLNAFTGWVYACTDKIAESVATIDIYLTKKSGKGSEYQRVDEHDVLNLLDKVNDFMTFSELVYVTVAHRLLEGNAFWYLVRDNGGRIREIWPLQPNLVTIEKDKATFIKSYKFQGDNNKTVELRPEEIIHFKKPNPLDAYRGIGVVAAAAMAIDTDNGASNYNMHFFENAAIPAGVLSTDGKLTTEQYERLKEQWNQKYQGSSNAHKTALLESGLKFQMMSLSQKDMDFLEQRRFSRDEILAMFKVPKSILGIVEDVNRANAEASNYSFLANVVDPEMARIVDLLNEFLLPKYPDLVNARLEYENPVPANEDLEIRKNQAGLQGGYYTINEVRAKEGLKPIDGGDIVYIPTSMQPIDMAGMPRMGFLPSDPQPADAKAVTKDVEPEGVEKRVKFIYQEIKNRAPKFLAIYNKQKADVVGKLTGKKSAKVNKGIINLIFEDWPTYIQLWEGEITDTVKASILTAGREIVTQVSASVAFDLLNPRVVTWMRDHAVENATLINNTVKDEVRKRLLVGVENGDSTTDIAKSIEQFFDREGEWRALRIARTEVIKGYAEGSMEGMRQSGVVRAKRWLTANDDRVEEECMHNQADGEIGLEDAFSSGHSAPPVHPNCRCTLTWVV